MTLRSPTSKPMNPEDADTYLRRRGSSLAEAFAGGVLYRHLHKRVRSLYRSDLDDFLERRANPAAPSSSPTQADRLAELAMDLAEHVTGGIWHPQEMDGSFEWMTVEEAAAYLRVSKDLVYREIRNGRFPALTVGDIRRIPRSGLSRVVILSAVLAHIEERSGPDALKGLLQTFFGSAEPPWPMQPVNKRGWTMAGRRGRADATGTTPPA